MHSLWRKSCQADVDFAETNGILVQAEAGCVDWLYRLTGYRYGSSIESENIFIDRRRFIEFGRKTNRSDAKETQSDPVVRSNLNSKTRLLHAAYAERGQTSKFFCNALWLVLP